MAWKKAAYAAVSCAPASAKSRTGSPVKNTENMVPVDCTTWGTPAADSASAAAALIVSAAAREVACRPRRWPAAAWPARRSWRPGSPTGCRPGRPAPPVRGGTSRRRGRRTPRPGSRRPSPCRRSSGPGASPRRRRRCPTGPRGSTRKPVITSSETNSAPWRGAGLGEEPVEPRVRRDHAHVAGRGLGDQAGDPVAVLGERGLDRGPVVVGQHEGERRRRRGHARGARTAKVARPEPAEASSESTCPW